MFFLPPLPHPHPLPFVVGGLAFIECQNKQHTNEFNPFLDRCFNQRSHKNKDQHINRSGKPVKEASGVRATDKKKGKVEKSEKKQYFVKLEKDGATKGMTITADEGEAQSEE